METTAAAKEINNRKERRQSSTRLGMSHSFAFLGASFVVGIVLQHIFESQKLGIQRTAVALVLVGVVAFIGTIAAGFKKNWHRLLTSNSFSVPLLVDITVLSVVGTLILQKQTPAVIADTYGPFANPITRLFLDDVFHSFGFSILLSLGAGAIILVTLRKRKLTGRYVGALGAHIGLLLILLGVAVGNILSVRGHLKMNTGQTSDHFTVTSSSGREKPYPLGFSVRLDDFNLLQYEPEYRLMVFDVAEKEQVRLASFDPVDDESLAGMREYNVKLIDYWPDYVVRTHVSPLPSKPDANVIAALGLAPEKMPIQWIFDEGRPKGGRGQIGDQRVVFFWDEKRAESYLESITGTGNTPHIIIASGEPLNVEVGRQYPIPNTDHKFEILRAFVDFTMESQSGGARNRSDSPNNPAIEVSIRDSADNPIGNIWLFAKFPDFKHQSTNSPVGKLRYQYKGSEDTVHANAIAVGETGQLWHLDRDVKVQSKTWLKTGGMTQLGSKAFKVHALHRAVIRSSEEASASSRADNPVAKIWVSGEREPRLVRPRQPIQLHGRNVLVLGPKGDNVRDYVSTLSVLESDRVVTTKKIEVNYPLEHNGFVFFQNDYRPDDPTFSGFQVVKDPGLWIVYLGLLTNFCGIFCVIFLPTFLKRNKRRIATDGDDA